MSRKSESKLESITTTPELSTELKVTEAVVTIESKEDQLRRELKDLDEEDLTSPSLWEQKKSIYQDPSGITFFTCTHVPKLERQPSYIDVRGDHYTREQRLGAGAAADTFIFKRDTTKPPMDPRNPERVTVKEMKPYKYSISELINEAIINVIYSGGFGGIAGDLQADLRIPAIQHRLILTYWPGKRLSDVKFTSPQQFLKVFLTAVRALKKFHMLDLKHGDLHDDNVIINEPSKNVYEANIIDFGSSAHGQVPHPTSWKQPTIEHDISSLAGRLALLYKEHNLPEIESLSTLLNEATAEDPTKRPTLAFIEERIIEILKSLPEVTEASVTADGDYKQ